MNLFSIYFIVVAAVATVIATVVAAAIGAAVVVAVGVAVGVVVGVVVVVVVAAAVAVAVAVAAAVAVVAVVIAAATAAIADVDVVVVAAVIAVAVDVAVVGAADVAVTVVVVVAAVVYSVEILERAHMVNCNPIWTPVDTESKFGDDVQQVCLYMHDPWEPHFSALKRILLLIALLLGEAEYRNVANAVAKTYWLWNLLRELHTPLSSATLFYYDNVSIVYLSFNSVQHQRTKHIEIDIHFV
ncbi:ribonuclease H-like domain-containing protein [Tanacetum coccineum]